MTAHDPRPLVAHVLLRFDTGGLENGVVNLINNMAPDAYRHAVIALTQITDFRQRIKRDDVGFFALDKPPGQTARIYPRLTRLFRQLRPAVVHSRNLAALETQVPAWFAGVPVRIHGEHGRDVGDLDGSNVKYRWVRRIYRPFVSRYVALSRDLERYLVDAVGIPQRRISQIYNGVDISRFSAREGDTRQVPGCPFTGSGYWIVGTVGRMQEVKDQCNLARAFVHALHIAPELRERARLVLVGDGPLRAKALSILEAGNAADLAWLPGERDDVPVILGGLDCFVLPSLAEGISNTILEAMACGLPVIATAVGGNPELLDPGVTGELVPAADPESLGNAIVRHARDPAMARARGRAGRSRVEQHFSLDAMTSAYHGLYDRMLREAGMGAQR
jgi:sugar transferase (PEP-CTERM/EpsH1 system associated)